MALTGDYRASMIGFLGYWGLSPWACFGAVQAFVRHPLAWHITWPYSLYCPHPQKSLSKTLGLRQENRKIYKEYFSLTRTMKEPTIDERDKIMNSLNSSRLDDYRKSGYKEVFWIASELSCDKCKALHDRIFPIDKVPPIPYHDGCRCTIGAVTRYTPRKGNRVNYDFNTPPDGFTF